MNREIYREIYEKLLLTNEKHVNLFRRNMRTILAYIPENEHEVRYGKEKFSHPNFTFYSVKNNSLNENSSRINLKITKDKENLFPDVIDTNTDIEMVINGSSVVSYLSAKKFLDEDGKIKLGSIYFYKDNKPYSIQFGIVNKEDTLQVETLVFEKTSFSNKQKLIKSFYNDANWPKLAESQKKAYRELEPVAKNSI